MIMQQATEQMTPGWLTDRLRAKAALQQGEVIQIEAGSEIFNQGFIANITKIKVSYTDDATGSLPENLLLKSAKSDLHPELLQRSSHEAKFYEAIAGLTTSFPIPTCYSVEYDE